MPREKKLEVPEAVRRLSNLKPDRYRNKVINAWSKDEGEGIVNMNRMGLAKRVICNDVVRSSEAGVWGQGFGKDGGLWHVHVKTSIELENSGKFSPHL